MMKKLFCFQYLIVFLVFGLFDKLLLNFADVSNDTNLLAGIAAHPFAALQGVSPDPQMPPLLGFALFPAHIISSFGITFLFSLRLTLFAYSLVAVYLLDQILILNTNLKMSVLIKYSIYLNLIVVVLILTQEDVLGYVFMLSIVLNLIRGKLREALCLLVVASLVAKILFLFLVFPLAFHILRSERHRHIPVYFLSIASPVIWLFGIVQFSSHGNSSVLGFKLPMFYSSNAWSVISNVPFLSESFLRFLSVSFLIFGFMLTFYAVRKSVPVEIWISISCIWLLIAVYQVQPEYMFFCIPFMLFQQSGIRGYIVVVLFPLAMMENLVFSFSNRNSSVHASSEKRELITKVLDSLPFLNSNLPSYFLAIGFSICALGVIVMSVRNIEWKHLKI
jgi:hypothetical protein